MIDSPRSHLDLPVEGMTCAGCVARIERRLNALDGVEASVNLALERAAVDYDAARVAPGDLVAAVAAAGYTARLPDAADPAAQRDDRLRLRVVVAALLAVPVIVYAMAGGVQTTGRDWIALALTLPVVVWCGWPIHRAALRSLRHGTATMDTLISMGVAAALGWSVVALLVPSWTDHLYLEVAAGVTLFILLGRYLEARAKRRGHACSSLTRIQRARGSYAASAAVSRRITPARA